MTAWGKMAVAAVALGAGAPVAAQTVEASKPETIMIALRDAG